MKLRTLIEKEERFLIFNIPSIDGNYLKREQKGIRTKDLASKTYIDFVELITSLGDKKWEENDAIDFLYGTVDFIYWDSKRGDYNYLNNKDIEDDFFKSLTHIDYKNYKEEI